jgi:hypothetical protein
LLELNPNERILTDRPIGRASGDERRSFARAAEGKQDIRA